MPQLQRNGVEIHYEVHGSGPGLLLSHGFSATSRMWDGQVEELSRDHQLVVWDMRGHGQSDYPADQTAYSEEATVGDMVALLDELELETAIVGGLSLGGYMSLAFHRLHPERVNSLLAISTGPGYKSDAGREAWNERSLQTAAGFEEKGLDQLMGRSKEMAAEHHRDATGLARAARGMLTQRDAGVIESLPGIDVPTLIVVGENDRPFLQAGEYMAKKIPGSQHRLIREAGHAVNIDQPEVFNRAVREFLDQHQL